MLCLSSQASLRGGARFSTTTSFLRSAPIVNRNIGNNCDKKQSAFDLARKCYHATTAANSIKLPNRIYHDCHHHHCQRPRLTRFIGGGRGDGSESNIVSEDCWTSVGVHHKVSLPLKFTPNRTFATSAGIGGADQDNMARIVAKEEMRRFIERVMVKVGVTQSHAASLADCLVTGDYRGHFSHGLNRLELYIKDVEQKSCKTEGEPVILNQTVATAWVDGKNLLGPVVGTFCMKLAIEKAKQSGIGWVVAKGSNHFGIAGYYSTMALQHNLVGMAFTNASPIMSATRAKQPFFGTNPISVAAPGQGGDNFVLDMATSVVALGKIELASRKEQPIPHGWAIDKNGNSITDPDQYHALLPLGDEESSSGYKGYGLGAMVEIFTAVLSGATVAPHVRNWTSNSDIADLGHCFVAINPDVFAPGFSGRMQGLMNDLRSQQPAEEGKPVLVAGDPEQAHMKKCDEQGGIEYHANQIKMANEIAQRLQIEPLKTL